MNTAELVGQLCMVGFEDPEVTPDFRAWMKEYRPGGIIFFSRNLVDPVQIARLTNELQTLAVDTPLLIAIDQEGGRVSRLPPPFTIFPPAATVARQGSTELAYQAAAVTARELRAVGVNMNMAPVLDIHTNSSNPIIGDRAFGTEPEQVSLMGAATIAGLHDHRIVACGKHFPGHGDTSTDSHVELPVVHASRTRLKEVEFKPFQYAMDHGLQALMTAHVHYTALDPANPATLSPIILSDLLRQQMGFSGVIVSDDLEMRAILDHSSIGTAAVRSLQAGVDLLLVCKTRELQTETIDTIRGAIENHELDENCVKASVNRIARVKQQFASPYQPIDYTSISRVVGIPAHFEVLTRIQTSVRTWT